MSDYVNSHFLTLYSQLWPIAVRILCCDAKTLSDVCLTISFTCTVYGNVGSVLCVAGSHAIGVPHGNTTCYVHTH